MSLSCTITEIKVNKLVLCGTDGRLRKIDISAKMSRDTKINIKI